MASVTTRSLAQIVLSWTAAAQTACTQVLDFSIGSVNLALAQAGGAIGLWLQKIALQVLGQTRFATSYGPDADSWGAQFQFTRLPATQATGQASFTITPGFADVIIPVGAVVQTADGTQSFAVTADATNTGYSATIVSGGGYAVPPGATSFVAPIQAQNAGTGGNVVAGAISALISPIDGVGGVTNTAALQNGLNAEADSPYKARFPNFLAGKACANRAAIVAAIQSVQQGLTYNIIPNVNAVGSALRYIDINNYFDEPGGFSYPTLVPWPGLVLVVVDDGSGYPSTNLLSLVAVAIDAVNGLGIQFQVIGPSVVLADATLTLTVSAGYDHGALASAAETALQNWLNTLPLGTSLVPLSRIPQVIYDGVPGVANVTGITINGQATDLTLNAVQVVKAGTIEVN